MKSLAKFEDLLDPIELETWRSLNSPVAIQAFLDETPYSTDATYRCPLNVLRDRKAHCFDGAVLAAAALQRLGYPPLLIDMLPENDDDHVLTIYKQDGRFGALAKSNFACLRSREPVYHTLKELVMSFFDVFYNVERQKTLRGYTLPLNLNRYERLGWLWRDEAMDAMAEGLDRARKISVVTPQMVARLSKVDELTYRSGLVGCNPDGLYDPNNPKH